MLLWKANIDVQYVAESSLALAHYVTGYITKAEKSHMQEVWDEIEEHGPLYNRLWKFGLKALHSHECGLYEAADILLGEHLCEKSDNVQWVNVCKPDLRKVRIKRYQELQQLAETDPHSCKLYQPNLLDDFYPNRPDHLRDVCLYDFVKWFRYDHTDKHGVRQYIKLGKPKIPNHKLYDVNKSEEREAYYYSLLLLFVPFVDESDLISEGQTAEEAFAEFFSKLDTMEEHHANLQKMLKAQTKIKAINDARKEEEVTTVKDENVVDEDGVKLVGEVVSAMQDVHDVEQTHYHFMIVLIC